jgi:hypothetical protein
VDGREEMVARNEALFRTVNENIEVVNESFGPVAGSHVWVCECGDVSCIEQIEMSADEYRALRANRTRFAVRPGHEIPDVETVVETHPGYLVVEKNPGIGAAVARAEAER